MKNRIKNKKILLKNYCKINNSFKFCNKIINNLLLNKKNQNKK